MTQTPPPALHVEYFAVGPLRCNCTIVADRDAGEAIVVDGGDEPERVLTRLSKLGVRAVHLVHTHAHIDHIGALAELHEATGANGLLHHADMPLYEMLRIQASWIGIPVPKAAKIDDDLRDGDQVRAGAATLDVLHTPGHTLGSVSFGLALDRRTMLLTGDTLFAGSVGRWDLGGTSLEDIVRSIRTKLLVFPDETVVVPGHGPTTTIGTERRENPFLTTPS
ncbi:MAG: MBL fold metallo-hydrolase [Candidatus Eremiobacteraeota bacterium]|nr:MBL fold metallo-hydrolase [Candidatus Eremiobacteraeota bacterium]